MRKFTEKDFESFERDGEYIICQSGDYTEIKIFPACCIFGEWCSFGECCIFGGWCSFGEHCSFGECCSFGEHCSFGRYCTCENGKEFGYYLKFEGFGSARRCTYFFKLTDGSIFVRCGCFSGAIDEFREQVKAKHNESKYAQGYLKIADLAEWQFSEVTEG